MPKKKEEEKEIVEKEEKKEGKKTNNKVDLNFHYVSTAILTGLIIVCNLVKTNIVSMASLLLSNSHYHDDAELIATAHRMTLMVCKYSIAMVFFLVLSMGLTWYLIRKKNKKLLYVQLAALGVILFYTLLKVLSFL